MVRQVPLPENSVAPATRAQWRRWLENNHDASAGVWVVTRREASRAKALPLEAVVEEALCFGWAELRTRSIDDERRLVWVAPRKAKAAWTAAHKALARRLATEGRMAAAGRASVKAAKESGAWSVLDAVEALAVPPDLDAALRTHGSVEEFARLAPSKRRIALEWIEAAKRPGTRAARVAETARLAKMGIVLTQWRINSRR